MGLSGTRWPKGSACRSLLPVLQQAPEAFEGYGEIKSRAKNRPGRILLTNQGIGGSLGGRGADLVYKNVG